MQQHSQLELTNHLSYQLSLLRLSLIPGPNHVTVPADTERNVKELERLVEEVVPARLYA